MQRTGKARPGQAAINVVGRPRSLARRQDPALCEVCDLSPRHRPRPPYIAAEQRIAQHWKAEGIVVQEAEQQIQASVGRKIDDGLIVQLLWPRGVRPASRDSDHPAGQSSVPEPVECWAVTSTAPG